MKAQGKIARALVSTLGTATSASAAATECRDQTLDGNSFSSAPMSTTRAVAASTSTTSRSSLDPRPVWSSSSRPHRTARSGPAGRLRGKINNTLKPLACSSWVYQSKGGSYIFTLNKNVAAGDDCVNVHA